MKRAVIDLGSNSVLLLIGEMGKESHVKSIHQEFEISRLGQNVAQTGMISAHAMKRTIAILNKYAEVIKRYNVNEVVVVGTHALRIAGNAFELVNFIEQKFNWIVNILSAEQEATYSYIGACDIIDVSKRKIMVIDIGGGSTEIILGIENQILDFQSLPIGVVNLGEKIAMKEKLSADDSKYLYNYIKNIFGKLSLFSNNIDQVQVIAVGGTITTLAAIKQKMKHYHSHKINGYSLTARDLHRLFENLNKLTLQQRRKVAGITAGREDIIIYGILMFIVFLELYHLDKVTVSDRGLRFGYLKWIEMNK